LTWFGWFFHEYGFSAMSVLASSGSAYAAFTSYRLSRSVASYQRDAQKRQVQIDLFEKRFEIYGLVENIGSEIRALNLLPDQSSKRPKSFRTDRGASKILVRS
jgi:hypothetical protein